MALGIKTARCFWNIYVLGIFKKKRERQKVMMVVAYYFFWQRECSFCCCCCCCCSTLAIRYLFRLLPALPSRWQRDWEFNFKSLLSLAEWRFCITFRWRQRCMVFVSGERDRARKKNCNREKYQLPHNFVSSTTTRKLIWNVMRCGA